jgi:hypothetical protein
MLVRRAIIATRRLHHRSIIATAQTVGGVGAVGIQHQRRLVSNGNGNNGNGVKNGNNGNGRNGKRTPTSIVIGGGVAGVTTSFYLALAGHKVRLSVTIYSIDARKSSC